MPVLQYIYKLYKLNCPFLNDISLSVALVWDGLIIVIHDSAVLFSDIHLHIA